MDKRSPVRDYSLLVPLLIGIVSILGICLVFISVGLSRGQDAQAAPIQTETPFKYIWLASETTIPATELNTAASPEIFSTPTKNFLPTSTQVSPNFLPTSSQVSTGSVTSLPALTEQIGTSGGEVLTPSVTITPNSIINNSTPMPVGTYDDTDIQIIRSGNWATQENIGNAYQGTLLVSNTVGNYIAFRFIGQQMVLGYQSGVDLGTVKITIDGVEFLLSQSTDQSLGNEWISDQILQGTHLVTITHASGASVNVDYIDIAN